MSLRNLKDDREETTQKTPPNEIGYFAALI